MNSTRVAALALCACLACDHSNPLEPFKAQGEGEVLPMNRLVEDVIDSGVVHRYLFEVSADSEYVVLFKSSHGFVGLSVDDPLTGAQLATVGSAPGPSRLEDNPSHNFARAQNGFVLIESFVIRGDSGRFQFKIVPVNMRPERAAASVQFGDAIVGETIDPLYDTDVFIAHGVAGRLGAAAIEPLGGDSGSMILLIEGPNHQMLSQVQAFAGSPLGTTGPLPLVSTQEYRLVVRTWGYPRPHRGAYRVWTYLINPAPDHAAATLAPNVVVGNERIDQPNDIDEFRFQDTAGAAYLAFIDAVRPFPMFVFSPTDSLIGGVIDHNPDTTLLHQGSNLIPITSTGSYKIRVGGGDPGQWLMADTGAYRLLLFRVDPRPESVPAAFQIGDTVSGEAIYPAGDIDELTVSATPGQQLRASFRLLANAVPSSNDLAFEVLDASTNAPLSQLTSQTAGPFIQGFQFTVPAGGTLRVRVGRVISSQVPRAPYEFYLSP